MQSFRGFLGDSACPCRSRPATVVKGSDVRLSMCDNCQIIILCDGLGRQMGAGPSTCSFEYIGLLHPRGPLWTRRWARFFTPNIHGNPTAVSAMMCESIFSLSSLPYTS